MFQLAIEVVGRGCQTVSGVGENTCACMRFTYAYTDMCMFSKEH